MQLICDGLPLDFSAAPWKTMLSQKKSVISRPEDGMLNCGVHSQKGFFGLSRAVTSFFCASIPLEGEREIFPVWEGLEISYRRFWDICIRTGPSADTHIQKKCPENLKGKSSAAALRKAICRESCCFSNNCLNTKESFDLWLLLVLEQYAVLRNSICNHNSVLLFMCQYTVFYGDY